jgi:hypothetical protein
MPLSDEDLLDFDMKRLGGLRRHPRRVLEEHGDAFRYQLVAARWIEQWAERVERPSPTKSEWDAGYARALREVVAHLRQGDFLPGGAVYGREAGTD